MHGVHLLLLQVRQIVGELVLQLLQHLDDAMGLELVGVRFRCAHRQAIRLLVKALRQEGVDRPLGIVRDEAEALQPGDLHQARLLPVAGLFVQDRNRPLQGIDGLRVVLVRRLVVCLLELAHLRRGLDVAIPD